MILRVIGTFQLSGRRRLEVLLRSDGERSRAPKLRSALGGIALLFSLLSASAKGPVPIAQVTYSTSIYNVYSGLITNNSPFLRQTRDGYLWVGTELGLSRFDGVRFVNFRVANTPELQSSLIRNLYEDKAGWLWIATQQGVCRYKHGKFERIGLDGVPVASILEDHAGSIWMATGGQGLWEYRDGHLISHANAPGMPPNPVLAVLVVDSRGRLWVGPRENVVIYDGRTARQPDLGERPFETVMRLAEAAQDVFWFETEKGIYRWQDGVFRHFGTEDGLLNQGVRNFGVDHKNGFWVVMNSVLRFDPSSERFIAIPTPGLDNSRSVMEDHEGSYWIGSSGDGVARIRPSGFHMLTAEDGILGGNTRAVAVDDNGRAWFGLSTTGIGEVAPDGAITVIPVGKGSSGEVWSILPARDGKLWIGTRTTLCVLEDGRLQEFPEFQRIRALFQDRSGTIWISSENEGTTCYKDGVFTSLSATIRAKQPGPPTVFPPMPMAFAEDAEGTLYLGLRENGGLVKIKQGEITVFHSSEGFPTNDIRAIHADREGNLWLGTKGRGLAVFTEGRWWNPDTISEPFNDLVSAILEDDEGRLWLGTPKGIMWASKAQLLAQARGEHSSQTFRLAQEGDGVRPALVGAGSFAPAAKGPDGTLWFATRRGAVKVHPREIQINQVPPPVEIEEAIVDGTHKVIPADGTIRLPAGTRSLTINYTGLSYVGPSQVLFRYRLEGHDPQWVDAGTRRTAFYTNLEPGSFRFHVVACNDDGRWNETGASVTVIQLPFFYQTKWFLGLMALGLAGVGLGLLRWRTAALKQRNLELEQGIAERTRELAKSYEAIRASEYFYHSLVESLPQIIARKDTEGRFTYANTAFGELVGHPLDHLIGRLESDLYPKEKAEKFRADDLRAMKTRQTLEYETIAERKGHPPRYLHVKKVPLYNQQGQAMGVQILFWDMTTFREIEEKLKQAQRELVETSRLAGIAEMATGILHNLGNALNSVNITTNMTVARIRRSKIDSIRKIAQLLSEHQDRLPDFFASDPRGLKLPSYLNELASHLAVERDETVADLEGLQASVDHIKEMVASQQKHARVAGVTEIVPASELVEYALRINESSLKRHSLGVAREFTAAPPVKVERQKALQIIGNLLTNARDALTETDRVDKRITLGVRGTSDGRVQIYVTDNGVGIAPENLTRIFAFGFTTKTSGHGFGLHSSALAATEMGGTLKALSDGLGQGSTFIFELPAVGEMTAEAEPLATADFRL